jgi:ABC-type branched-subunit amino acid transport system substrate-binding protein
MVKLTAKALSAVQKPTPDNIAESLMKTSRGYVGVTGDKTFDANGDVGAQYGRWTVKKGEIVDYK